MHYSISLLLLLSTLPILSHTQCPVPNAPPHCTHCTPSRLCLACRNNFYVDSFNHCAPCPAGCSKCPGKVCEACKPGLTLTSDKRCVVDDHDPECGSRCVECEDEKCVTCEHGYQADQGVCRDVVDSCPFDNCRLCVHDDECAVCQEGFEWDMGTPACTVSEFCLSNCLECEGEDDDEDKRCERCESDYNLSPDGRCVPICHVDNCEICAEYDWDTCAKCKSGFNRYADGSSCDTCEEGCKSCNSQFCLNCEEGYTLGDGKCERNCKEKDCEICGATGCSKCKKGTHCLLTCTDYDCEICDGEACKECFEGFSLVNGRCTPTCDVKNCAYCYGNVCDQCGQGYTLVDGGESCEDNGNPHRKPLDISSFKDFDIEEAVLTWFLLVHFVIYIIALYWGKQKDKKQFGCFNTTVLFNLYQMIYFEKLNRREALRVGANSYAEGDANEDIEKPQDFEAYHLRMSGMGPFKNSRSSDHSIESKSSGKGFRSRFNKSYVSGDSEFPSSEEFSSEEDFSEDDDFDDEYEESCYSDPTSSATLREEYHGDFDDIDGLSDDGLPIWQNRSMNLPKKTKEKKRRPTLKHRRGASHDYSSKPLHKTTFQTHFQEDGFKNPTEEELGITANKKSVQPYVPRKVWSNDIESEDAFEGGHKKKRSNKTVAKQSSVETALSNLSNHIQPTKSRLKTSTLSTGNQTGQTTSFLISKHQNPKIYNLNFGTSHNHLTTDDTSLSPASNTQFSFKPQMSRSFHNYPEETDYSHNSRRPSHHHHHHHHQQNHHRQRPRGNSGNSSRNSYPHRGWNQSLVSTDIAEFSAERRRSHRSSGSGGSGIRKKVAIVRRENCLSVAINPEPPKLCDYIKSDFKERHTLLSIYHRDDILASRVKRITVFFLETCYVIIIVGILIGFYTVDDSRVFVLLNPFLASIFLAPVMYFLVLTFRFPFATLRLLAEQDFGHKGMVVERLQSKQESRFWRALILHILLVAFGLFYVFQYIVTANVQKNWEIIAESYMTLAFDLILWESMLSILALWCLHVEYQNHEVNWKTNLARRLRFIIEVVRDFRSIQT